MLSDETFSPDVSPLSKRRCPLCGSHGLALYHDDSRRHYYHCRRCDLVSVAAEHLPGRAEEKARYELHENSPDDEGYRAFLSRLFVPLNRLLTPSSIGLDFGSGPGPTLSVMFEEAGHEMHIYDPFFANDPAVLRRTYDFVTATETFEHFHRPGEVIPRIVRCLRPGSWLGVMTKLVKDQDAFRSWHYIQCPTHVSFYSKDTVRWIAARWGLICRFVDADVILLRKL